MSSVAIFLVLVGLAGLLYFERRKYELCLSDLNDPTKSQHEKATVIGPVCERFKTEFRAKYNKEP